MTKEELNNKLIEVANKSEQKVLKQRDYLERRGIKWQESDLFKYYVAELFGVIECLKAVEIDIAEYEWVYKYSL